MKIYKKHFLILALILLIIFSIFYIKQIKENKLLNDNKILFEYSLFLNEKSKIIEPIIKKQSFISSCSNNLNNIKKVKYEISEIIKYKNNRLLEVKNLNIKNLMEEITTTYFKTYNSLFFLYKCNNKNSLNFKTIIDKKFNIYYKKTMTNMNLINNRKLKTPFIINSIYNFDENNYFNLRINELYKIQKNK